MTQKCLQSKLDWRGFWGLVSIQWGSLILFQFLFQIVNYCFFRHVQFVIQVNFASLQLLLSKKNVLDLNDIKSSSLVAFSLVVRAVAKGKSKMHLTQKINNTFFKNNSLKQ